MGNDYSREISELREEIARVGTRRQEEIAEENGIEASLLEKPWRKFERMGDWTEEYRQRLVTDICKHKAHQKMDSARILFIGPINSGKSSFLNSVSSIDKNRISASFLVGSANVSLSTKLKQYIPKGELKNFILLDTMGLEPSEHGGLIVQNFIYLINGNVPPNYLFNTSGPIDATSCKEFIINPTVEQKPHCIVIVLDSSVMPANRIPDATKEKITELQKHLRTSDIQAVIILTKIDKLCTNVQEDVKNTYSSRKVKKVIEQTSDLFGVPPMNIFPVKNYFEEPDLHHEMDILILLALRKMMHVASDRLDTIDNQITTPSPSDTQITDKHKIRLGNKWNEC